MKKILLFCASLAVAAMFSGCDGKDALSGTTDDPGNGTGTEEPEGPEEPVETQYAIGDYYDEVFLKGIVFYVDETGSHGYIMSLDETRTVWSFRDENVMDGYYAPDGTYNTACVQAMDNWRENYPGFLWADDKNVMNLDNWYVPSCTELAMIHEAYTENGHDDPESWFNGCITSNGGTPLADVLYWSSEEMGVSHAYPFDMSAGDRHLSTSDNYKSNEYPFRAISRF